MSETKVITIDADKLSKNLDKLNQEKDVEIKSAILRDSLCNYSYELMTGKTVGDVLNRKGNHIVHEDLSDAMSKFDVFLAHLDDAYTGNDNSTELSFLESEPETENYSVSSFKITGVEENKSLILSGTKTVNAGAISFDTPKVKLNGQYLYLNQLIETLDKVVFEVERYMGGKSAPQPEQMHMTFAEEDDSFEKGKVAVSE